MAVAPYLVIIAVFSLSQIPAVKSWLTDAGGFSFRWPGLDVEHRYEGRDLALTTDFRAVFSEIASKHLGAAKLDTVFPGYNATGTLGLI